MLRRPEDEAISLFAGLLANPDVPLSLEDQMSEVVVLDVHEIFPLCVYTFVCVEIKTKREATAFCMIQNV